MCQATAHCISKARSVDSEPESAFGFRDRVTCQGWGIGFCNHGREQDWKHNLSESPKKVKKIGLSVVNLFYIVLPSTTLGISQSVSHDFVPNAEATATCTNLSGISAPESAESKWELIRSAMVIQARGKRPLMSCENGKGNLPNQKRASNF